MKKVLCLILALLTLLSLLCACAKQAEAPETEPLQQPETEAEAEAGAENQLQPNAADPHYHSISGVPKPPSFMDAEYVLDDPSLRSGKKTKDNARVFYEIFVGSFSDSDADGIGDLRGIINRMDYLNDGDPDSGRSLGVEGIWLTPIFKSPSYHKYGVTDYYTIDPKFGTMDDLRELIALCHERNVKLILDLTINHSGSRCQWFSNFVAAHQRGDTESDFYDFYSWCGPDRPALSGHRYQTIPGTGDAYECNFADTLPEYNMDSEIARQALLDVAKYYLEMGVDGFRFDAVPHIYYGNNLRSAAFMDWYLGELRAEYPDMYAVSEVWANDSITDLYVAHTNCFNFTTSQYGGLISATARGGSAGVYALYVENYLNRIHRYNGDALYVPFLSNHDTDRSAGYLSLSGGQIKMAANLYILNSGSPFIYYGEELGMRGYRGESDTDANRRLAMVWNDGDTVRDPVGSTFDDQITTGVAEQIEDPDSLYTYYKKLLMIRHANPEIARGTYKAYSVPGTQVGGFFATYKKSTVLVLHNPSRSAVTVDLSGLGLSELRAAIGMGGASLSGTTLVIDAQTSVVLK
ncbi:MAG: hypothetical protein IK149_04635 [Oscillospiraceae bacterium]|nr:hypothetical protein [Oscillospiraceae bacterium]